jgi:voltage-gated potassium channel
MFMGLTIFAMFTGTVSAFMVERFRGEGNFVDWEQLQDHIVICGWNSKSEIIVQEYRASPVSSSVPIAVIAQLEGDQTIGEVGPNVYFLNDDFTRVPALERVGIHRARTCIILADISGGRSEQDADARTILAALTVEKLNPAVYTCAELLNRSYGTHLTMGHVNDYVVSGEYSAYMLAQAAMNRGLMGVFTELLTYQRGNEFYRLDVPEAWHGRSFLDVFVELKKTRNVTLVAVHAPGGEMMVNPADYTFGPGDEVVVIAQDEIKL